MARAAVKAKQAQRAQTAPAKPRQHGRRRHAAGGNPNQQLFFVRIRKRQKWVFALLAALFALTFAFVGVGSGTQGLDQLFSGINIFGSSGPSVSKAQHEVDKNPKDPKGYRDLATAYEAKGQTSNAITALQGYTNLKPKDASAWSELAGLQATLAQDYLTQYQSAYQAQQLAAPSSTFLPTGKLATAIGTNPIESAASSDASTVTSNLQQQTEIEFNAVVTSWQKLTKLQPKNSDAWFQLAQAAQTAGNSTTAVAAYKTYLKLNPASQNAAQIRQLIKELAPPPAASGKKKK
jgi:Flp pilus assembly protein TadD